MNPQMPPSHPNLPTERAPAQFTTSLTPGERDEQDTPLSPSLRSNGFGPVIGSRLSEYSPFFFFYFAPRTAIQGA